ncbi:hypothetical protein Bca52824_094104 [Brassica carinata]|uniref:Uncharacterized protein n=1 Tax=Brassica carinata TaxID=52824 RepID=A0A8X7TL46_BRACI|nr:hypothetical protein Bca52824_094104 [Brassica carinata]
MGLDIRIIKADERSLWPVSRSHKGFSGFAIVSSQDWSGSGSPEWGRMRGVKSSDLSTTALVLGGSACGVCRSQGVDLRPLPVRLGLR